MAYSAASFINTYSNSDIVINLKTTTGVIVNGFNVCNYQTSSYEGSQLLIAVHERTIILDFENEIEASAAWSNLRVAINNLYPNCTIGGPGGSSESLINSSYAHLKSLQATNSLIALSWYDVSSLPTGLSSILGNTIRIKAKSTNDYLVSGLSLSTNWQMTINLLDDSIQFLEDASRKIITQNNSSITISPSDTSSYIYASDNSAITPITSTNIRAVDNSSLVVTSCTNISADHSALTLVSASNSTFQGITANLAAYSIANITVDSRNSIGKLGFVILTTSNQDLNAYVDTIHLSLPDMSGVVGTTTINKKLKNPIAGAEAEFRISVANLNGTHAFSIQDAAATELLKIVPGTTNKIFTFKWDKTLNAGSGAFFYYSTLQLEESIIIVNPSSDGQTVFTDIINPAPITVSSIQMFVNGQKQYYTLDFTVTVNLTTNIGTVNWLNTDFSLETTDTIEFRYLL
jgi:hypothetical protein